MPPAASLTSPTPPVVVVLGGGINGAALARELLLAGLSVHLVDAGDLASGATAYSSRLIHGGLRYLEYGELSLVRESLTERSRLAQLAPHLVQPLRLHIPVPNRWGGFGTALERLIRRRGGQAARGLMLVRAGLALYDRFGRDPAFPPHTVHRLAGTKLPLASDRFRWVCSFSDAQVLFPERLVIALLEDARQLAQSTERKLHVWTYHRAWRQGADLEIHPCAAGTADDATVPPGSEPAARVRPAAVINATGAWVDDTLASLTIPSPPLMGGTKGSHLVLNHPWLRQAVGDAGLYVEAADLRPVFILPFERWLLVGTTDLPYAGDPAAAVATDAEVEYLLATINEVFPQAAAARDQVLLHYSGVRPLPASTSGSTAGITRRHWLEEHKGLPWPCFSVIGGKLTTCRSLAEQAVAQVQKRLGLAAQATSAGRMIPGGADYPTSPALLAARWARLQLQSGLPLATVQRLWRFYGTRLESVLADCRIPPTQDDGSALPLEFVRQVIRQEWVTRLEDLVERRLLALYDPELTQATLAAWAALLVDEGRLAAPAVAEVVAAEVLRLQNHFGRLIPP